MKDDENLRAQSGGRQQGKTYGDVPELLRREFEKHVHQTQVADRLHRRWVLAPKVRVVEAGDIDQHMIDALTYGIGAKATYDPTPPIQKHSDADMVMEMIRRGYACMKLPEGGGPPEVFRK